MNAQLYKLKQKLLVAEARISRLQFEIETMRATERMGNQSDCFSLDISRRHVQEMIEARIGISDFPKTRKAGNEVRALLKSGRDFPALLSAKRVPFPFLPPYHLMSQREERIAERPKG